MSKKFLQAAGIVAALGVAALPLANTFAVDDQTNYYHGTDTVQVTIETSCGVFNYTSTGAEDVSDQEWTDGSYKATVKLGSLTEFNVDVEAVGNEGDDNYVAGKTHADTRVIICNNGSGASIKAAGGSYQTDENDRAGTTDRVTAMNSNTNDGDSAKYTIATGTATSGDTSSWSFKATTGTNSVVSIEDGYSDWVKIPDTKTEIASTSAETGQANGQWYPSYRVYVGNKQAADTYTGHVTYFAELPATN